MFTRIRNSWQLMKQSCRVLMENKKLLWFPLINGIFTIVVLLFFVSPLFFWPTGHSLASGEHWDAVLGSLFNDLDTADDQAPTWSPIMWGVYVALYLLSMFLITFLNTAFFNEIIRALNGEQVSLRGGFAFACKRLKPIALWSLFAGLVGVILRLIEERLSFVGRWVIALIGVVWSVASVFAIPVIIRDPNAGNPLKVLKHSALLIKERWGEGLAGYVGLSGVGGLLITGWTVLVTAVCFGLAQTGLDVAWIIGLGLCMWTLTVFVFSYLLGVISRIFQCALYVYAAEGSMPGPFDAEAVDQAWKVKRKKS